MKAAAMTGILATCILFSGTALGAPRFDVPDDYPTIQAAIDACPSDACYVRVDPGTWIENIDFGGKSIMVYSRDGADVTTIDGNQDGSVVNFETDEGPDSILQGFTLRNGRVEGWAFLYGGGIHCAASSPTITDCVITENRSQHYGAGISCTAGASPTISNCTITENLAERYHGGGIFCHGSSFPTITDCFFRYNSTHMYGGAIYCESSSPTITGCTFTGNSGSYGGGAICCNASSSPTIAGCTITDNHADDNGGGIACLENSSPEITDCTISGNWVNMSGGGIYGGIGFNSLISNCTISGNETTSSSGAGGGILCTVSSPTFVHCDISGNTAHVAGGIWAEQASSVTFSHCTIRDNVAVGDGGGVFLLDGATASLTNCLVTGNIVTGGGPGERTGGGFACYQDSFLTLNHCTVSGNSADLHGGGVYCLFSSADIINSIFWGDSPDAIYSGPGGSATVTYSDVEGGYPGTGNLDADPLFVGGEDFRILESSPCVDAGTDSGVYDDMDLNPRPQGGGFDMGAYELTDLDGDGWFSFEDCDDSDPDVNPGAHEVCDNGIDDDCDGAIDSDDLECAVIHVPADQPTIQLAINAAVGGNLILVAPGTYEENISFQGKRITLQSEEGPGETAIDGNQDGFVVLFGNYETQEAVLDGFSIKNGFASNGGGIYCIRANPRIENCRIEKNIADNSGGGIYCYVGSPTITNCLIVDNSAGLGGALTCMGGSPLIENCTLSDNRASRGEGMVCDSDADPIVTNSILWGNDDPGQPDLYVISGYPVVTYSDVEGGWTGTGNIDSNPHFVKGYYLSSGSPCVDGGSPDPAYDDECLPPSKGTERNDMGTYGGPGGCAWCDDFDGDGYVGLDCGGEDCDDADPGVYPGAEEICDNGIDDDCDGLVDRDDPDCATAVFTCELDAFYDAGLMSLIFTIGTPEEAVWANYLILTYPDVTVIPLWTVPLPVIDPPIDIPISFSLPSLGTVGIWTGLFVAGVPEETDMEWVDTGGPKSG